MFLSPRSDVAPNALLHSLKHYKVLHERVVLATVTVADTPFVPPRAGCRVEKLGKGFFSLRFVYGFFEMPDIPEALAAARAHGLALDMDSVTFFLGRETLVPGDHPSLPRWRVALYMWLASNALSPARFIICRQGASWNSAPKSRSDANSARGICRWQERRACVRTY